MGGWPFQTTPTKPVRWSYYPQSLYRWLHIIATLDVPSGDMWPPGGRYSLPAATQLNPPLATIWPDLLPTTISSGPSPSQAIVCHYPRWPSTVSERHLTSFSVALCCLWSLSVAMSDCPPSSTTSHRSTQPITQNNPLQATMAMGCTAWWPASWLWVGADGGGSSNMVARLDRGWWWPAVANGGLGQW